MAVNVDKVISFLYQNTVGKGAPVRDLVALKSAINIDEAAQAIAAGDKVSEFGFNTDEPIIDQLNAVLGHDQAESKLLAVLLSQTDSNNVINLPDMVCNDTDTQEISVDGLSFKDKSLDVRLGGDLVNVQVTDDGDLQITPKAPISESQQVVIYVKEDDKFVKLNLAPSTASATTPEENPGEAPQEGKGSIWKSIGRWSIFGVSLYSLLGIFRSEKNWLGIIAGAIGTGLTAFWGKIKGGVSDKDSKQPPPVTAEQGTA